MIERHKMLFEKALLLALSAATVNACADDPTYVGQNGATRGWTCLSWAAWDCTTANSHWGYTNGQMRRLWKKCPVSCQCPTAGRDACGTNPGGGLLGRNNRACAPSLKVDKNVTKEDDGDTYDDNGNPIPDPDPDPAPPANNRVKEKAKDDVNNIAGVGAMAIKDRDATESKVASILKSFSSMDHSKTPTDLDDQLEDLEEKVRALLAAAKPAKH